MQRREFLTSGALTASAALLTSKLSFANTPAKGKARFVFIILRGALDGLAAVPPYGDRDYTALRGGIALRADKVLPLNDLFGLHPSLAFMNESYAARELVVFHAVATAYRERSHFDGQDVLENGLARAHAAPSGWLNRALGSLPRTNKEPGVALGQNIPLVMRGPAEVTSWSPAKLTALDEDTLQRITDLYAADPVLAKRLADALAADAIAADGDQAMLGKSTGVGARYSEVIRAAAEFLRREDGPTVVVFDTTGWDTHANEGSAQGQLAARLAALDAGLRSLKEQLGPVWNDTAVVLATEFGRTAAINGTRGTDHGTGAAAFLVGGAVRGGRVVADWPGLSKRALYQGRDLMPTLDIRSVLKGVMEEQLLVPATALEATVFPESGAAKTLSGLIRT